jgi:hypothetical protein
LHGADSRAAIFLLILRAGHEFARLDIGHNHASLSLSALLQVLPAPTSTVARMPQSQGGNSSTRGASVTRGLLRASGRWHNRTPLIPSPRRESAHTRILASTRNQARADRLERFGARHFACQPLLALPQRGLSLLGLRDVASNLGASDNPARGSRNGEIVSETSMRSPALVTRTVS